MMRRLVRIVLVSIVHEAFGMERIINAICLN